MNSSDYVFVADLDKHRIQKFSPPGAPVTPPVASFTTDTTSDPAPLAVLFNDTSSHTPTIRNWSFTNVTPRNNTQRWFSTYQNATRTFGVGHYSIVLNASNSAGHGISTKVTFINVTAAPVVTNVTSKIGIFRPSSEIWSLDSNGNYIWEVSDKSLTGAYPMTKPRLENIKFFLGNLSITSIHFDHQLAHQATSGIVQYHSLLGFQLLFKQG